MARRNIVVGLDIGTTKTVVLVGEATEGAGVELIGVGEAPSQGMRRGSIVNLEETVRAVDLALERAEHFSGAQITGAFVGVAGPTIGSFNNRGVAAVRREDREILEEDVKRAMNNARCIAIPEECSIIHILPRQFIVDGNEGIHDPVGMTGTRLEVEVHIVTGAYTFLQNVVKSVQRAGIKVQGLVLNPLGAAEAVLYPAEKELGALLVDIGGGTTDLALYAGGSLWFTSVLPVGGDHITSDLAVGLRTTHGEAERIKIEYGTVCKDDGAANESVEVASLGWGKRSRVPRAQIAEIIIPRVQEILDMVRQEVERSGYRGVLPGGAVFTGGGALLKGFLDMAQAELGLPVRLGRPVYLKGLADMVNSPGFAAAAGVLLYAARNFKEEMASRGDPLLGGLWGRIKSWLKELA